MQNKIDSGFGLAEAFSVGKGSVVSLVGAGGKTTTLYALSLDLRRRGLSVITTSTTHMQIPFDGTTAPPLVVIDREDNWLKSVKSHIARFGSVTVVQSEVRKDKLRGIEPVAVDPLRSLADCVLIEADGARGRPLKAFFSRSMRMFRIADDVSDIDGPLVNGTQATARIDQQTRWHR